MAVYKVPQDVEAEDKLVGPFTLKQSIFLVGAVLSGWLTYVLYNVNPAFSILTLPFLIVFLILGVYRRPDQPVEVYLTSLIRFYIKPRRRIWDRDGLLETVKITAPPKVEHYYSDGRSRDQVESQLKGLANVMDTRGWSTKSASVQLPGQTFQSSDRLVGASDIPNTVQPTEVHDADDMMDPNSNTNAQYMSQMSNTYNANYRQAAVSQMNPTPQPEPVLGAPQTAPATNSPASQDITSQEQIDQLARNTDLNVSTIARKANQNPKNSSNFSSDQEISLR